jgi:polysaccharide deacetylase family protein (PEP-CTERM system associated)
MPHFLITVDVEDWFQVENLRPWNPVSTWDSRELRVEANVHKLLDLFDEVRIEAQGSKLEAKERPEPRDGQHCGAFFKGNSENPVRLAFAPYSVRRTPSLYSPESSLSQASSLKPQVEKKVRCTFFTLGWLAERLPNLVREIAARGHEVASHGSRHRMCKGLTHSDLRSELVESKHLLEDITAQEVSGFRAPSFSVDDRVLSLLQEYGYRYDSSYNNFALHGCYGKIRLTGIRAGVVHKLTDSFYEIPVSNLNLSSNLFSLQPPVSTAKRNGNTGFVLPWSGGAYFRLMPFEVFLVGVRSILNKDGAYVFYIHPWEIDPRQPQVHSASINRRFRHYTNLNKTYQRLKDLIASFNYCNFVTCHEYLREVTLTG